VGRALDQIAGQRLTAQVTDVYPIGFTNLHRVKTRRLTAYRVNSGRGDFDVLAIADQPAKKPLRNRATTNIAGANKENAFHDWRRARERATNVGLNSSEVNRTG
jgi:hypothetical protein